MNSHIAQYKQELAHFHDSLEVTLGQPEDALEQLQHYTQFVDKLLRKIWAECHIDNENYCLIAIGGYGRRELYPYADIDILILTATSVQENKALEAFLQTLWDLKLRASAITTTYDELIILCKNNLYTLTSILDQHFLAGSAELYHLLCQQGGQLLYLSSEEFYQQKCQEQKERHLRFGQYALSLEPNIKESPGGLRDLQTLLWCWKYAYCKQKNVFIKRQQHVFLSEMHELVAAHLLTEEERLAIHEAYSFLVQSRFTLHIVAGKYQDKLSIEMQTLLMTFCEKQEADYLLTQRDFMRQYYRCVLTLTYYLQILHKELVQWLKESKALPNIVVSQIHSATAPLSALLQTTDPTALNDVSAEQLRSYYLRQDSKLDFLSLEAQTLFLSLLNRTSQVYSLLKHLHVWGLLCRYFPELEFSIGLIQQSLFHSYTVDEHTLLLTAMIDRFYSLEAKEAYPICHEIIVTIDSPQVLYLAALLHDSGKGRTEDHSLVGKKLAIQACERLKDLLTLEQRDNLVWLVEYHLLMSNVAQKQDIHDPDVIIQFAKQVVNLNRLKLIYLLTIADISATNPSLWNSWKDSLLRKLYLQTEKALEHDYMLSPINKQVTRKKEKVLDLFKKNHPHSFDATTITALWQDWPEIYFLHHTVPSIAKHTAAILQKDKDAVFYFSDHKRQGHYELLFVFIIPFNVFSY